MNIQVTYIFIPIVSHKDWFCHRGKSKLGIRLFIHELLREPLIQDSGLAIWKYSGVDVRGIKWFPLKVQR